MPAPDVEQVEIFLARNVEDRMQLAKVPRDIDPDGTVNTILEQVLAGPNLEEQEQEFVSPFIEGSTIVGTTLRGTLLEIHLDSLNGFPQDDSTSNRLAYAMLVCTATELIIGAEIQLVQILVERDGELSPINIPVSDGDRPRGVAHLSATFIPRQQVPERSTDKSPERGPQASRSRQPRRLRTAWAMRCSFSMRANRTNPSPPGPKPTPGDTATSASRTRWLANSTEPMPR